MAAGTGAINLCVGGSEVYHGKPQQRSILGAALDDGARPSAVTLQQSCRLVHRSIALRVIVIALLEFTTR